MGTPNTPSQPQAAPQSQSPTSLSFPCEVGRTFIFKADNEDDYMYIMSNNFSSGEESLIGDVRELLLDELGITLISVDNIRA